MPPLVSVIVATYNRSAVLRHALGSVLTSTLQDVEVIVVGDHCTDDTAQVVAAFADVRLRFVNLPENCGEQSGPTNHALAMASGRYIAFLNQDDLFFPDHLETAVAALQRTAAEFVWTPTLVLEPAASDALREGRWQVTIGSTPPAGVFDPLTFCVASSWVVDRRALPRIGTWRPGRELFVSPSQDWMFRASQSGVTLAFLPRPTVVAIYSGARAGSYARRDCPEHDACAPRLGDAAFREELLAAAAVSQAAAWNASGQGNARRRLARRLAGPLRALCVRAGLHPLSAHLVLRLYRRGTLIGRHRRYTGLPSLPSLPSATPD